MLECKKLSNLVCARIPQRVPLQSAEALPLSCCLAVAVISWSMYCATLSPNWFTICRIRAGLETTKKIS